MAGNHSRSGKRVEEFVVNDNPHERYQMFHPYSGKELTHGIPILMSTSNGCIVRKEINHYIVSCPECCTTVEYDDDSEPICPDCGLVCAGGEKLREERVVCDAKAAGRHEE
jgi:hypothetical protein